MITNVYVCYHICTHTPLYSIHKHEYIAASLSANSSLLPRQWYSLSYMYNYICIYVCFQITSYIILCMKLLIKMCIWLHQKQFTPKKMLLAYIYIQWYTIVYV